MYVIVGVVSLLVGALASAFAFFGLRLVAARVAGVKARKVIFAFDMAPWAGIPLALRALFALAGPTGCYLVAVAALTAGFLAAGDVSIDETSMRVRVVAASPAAMAGVQDGDQIINVAAVPIHDWDQLRSEVAKHANDPTVIVLSREGANVTVTATPSAQGKIGVAPPMIQHPVGFGSALARGSVEPFRINFLAARAFFRIFGGREKAEFSGPVAIAQETGRARQSGLGMLLKLLGALTSYFLFFPLVLSLVFFPRARKVV